MDRVSDRNKLTTELGWVAGRSFSRRSSFPQLGAVDVKTILHLLLHRITHRQLGLTGQFL